MKMESEMSPVDIYFGENVIPILEKMEDKFGDDENFEFDMVNCLFTVMAMTIIDLCKDGKEELMKKSILKMCETNIDTALFLKGRTSR